MPQVVSNAHGAGNALLGPKAGDRLAGFSELGFENLEDLGLAASAAGGSAGFGLDIDQGLGARLDRFSESRLFDIVTEADGLLSVTSAGLIAGGVRRLAHQDCPKNPIHEFPRGISAAPSLGPPIIKQNLVSFEFSKICCCPAKHFGVKVGPP